MLVQFLVQDQIFLQACFSEKHLIILYALQYNLSSFSWSIMEKKKKSLFHIHDF